MFDFGDILALLLVIFLTVSLSVCLILSWIDRCRFGDLPVIMAVVDCTSKGESFLTGICDPTIDFIISVQDGDTVKSYRKTYHVTYEQMLSVEVGDIVEFEHNEPVFEKEGGD